MKHSEAAARNIERGMMASDAQVLVLAGIADALVRIADEMAKSRDLAMAGLTTQEAARFNERWTPST